MQDGMPHPRTLTVLYDFPDQFKYRSHNGIVMCESTVFLEENGKVKEVMKDVSRIVIHGDETILTDILGQRLVLNGIALKEANLMSHGIVFARK
jgi:predicted RNA-binding protein